MDRSQRYSSVLFSGSDLAFLIILLVNQDLTIDNFYEFINPGYMLDYGTVEKLRANFFDRNRM